MKLKNLLKNLAGVKKVEGKASVEIKGLACDSKAIKDGFLFVVLKGSRFNGSDFIDEAIDRGASAVMLEPANKDSHTFNRGATFIYVDDVKHALSHISMAFYGDLSAKMCLIGVTGTNGKTTTTYLLESLLDKLGKKTGVIGTINYRFGARSIPALNTTPGILDLYSLLSGMYKKGIKTCVIEVSSHSLEQGRVDTLHFDMAVFTNLTHEHMDFHKNMKNYIASKAKLFSKIKKGGFAVINTDDPYSGVIIKKAASEKKAAVVTYGINTGSDIKAKNIDFSSAGLSFDLCYKGNETAINSRLIGRHNVYNILAAGACGIVMGMDTQKIALVMKEASAPPGRLEKIDCGQDFSVFVDYAHTENGMENVLRALRELEPGRLIVVFGCGGDRDKAKRPNMGRVSSELSDKIYITSDNPRSEDPMSIIAEIKKGIVAGRNNFVVEEDRFKAIDSALKEAKKGDIVLVAGKGHETYQVLKNVILPFDDRKAVRKILCGKYVQKK